MKAPIFSPAELARQHAKSVIAEQESYENAYQLINETINDLNIQMKNATGSYLFNPNEDADAMRLLCFLFRYNYAGEIAAAALKMPIHKFRKYISNLKQAGLIVRGKIILSDWLDKDVGWVNMTLDLLCCQGQVIRTKE